MHYLPPALLFFCALLLLLLSFKLASLGYRQLLAFSRNLFACAAFFGAAVLILLAIDSTSYRAFQKGDVAAAIRIEKLAPSGYIVTFKRSGTDDLKLLVDGDAGSITASVVTIGSGDSQRQFCRFESLQSRSYAFERQPDQPAALSLRSDHVYATDILATIKRVSMTLLPPSIARIDVYTGIYVPLDDGAEYDLVFDVDGLRPVASNRISDFALTAW